MRIHLVRYRLGAALLVLTAGCASAARPVAEPNAGSTAVTTTSTTSTRHPSPSPKGTAAETSTSTTSTTTAPADGGDQPAPTVPVTALVIGDFGWGTAAESALAAEMSRVAAEVSPAALVTTGDNLYGDDQEDRWQRPFAWVADRGMDVWIAWGNHDIESQGRRRAVEAAFGPPGRWYSKPLGSALLVFVDSNQVNDSEQAAWLRTVLAANTARPVVVSFHHPALSCSSHGSTPEVQRRWKPLFDRYGADLILNGHDHNYQHFEPGGAAYVVTGGGGSPLYPVTACPQGTAGPVAWNDTDNHFLVVTSFGDALEVTARSAGGEVIDHFWVRNRVLTHRPA